MIQQGTSTRCKPAVAVLVDVEVEAVLHALPLCRCTVGGRPPRISTLGRPAATAANVTAAAVAVAVGRLRLWAAPAARLIMAVPVSPYAAVPHSATVPHSAAISASAAVPVPVRIPMRIPLAIAVAPAVSSIAVRGIRCACVQRKRP